MESTGVPSRVQISKHVVENVEEGEFEFEARGQIQVKGKGLVEAFMLKNRLKPRDAYYVGAEIVPPTDDMLADLSTFSHSRRGSGGAVRRRTSTLQSTLLALQASMMDSSASSSLYAKSTASSIPRDAFEQGDTGTAH